MTRWLAAALLLLIPGMALAQSPPLSAPPLSAPTQLAQARSVPGQATPVPTVPGGFTPAQRAEIVDIVRAALQSDPSILRDAVRALQADESLRHEAAARQAISESAATLAAASGDQVAGNPAGDVTVVEFYDIRCPYCRRMLPVIDHLLREDGRIRWVYKEIPILGPASVTAAKAVLAAQRQGGYAALHDALMSGTPDISDAVVKDAAEHAGLDWPRLRRDMDDPAIKARLDANIELARKLEIDGTPAYVIGARMIPGAVDEATLREAVASARAK